METIVSVKGLTAGYSSQEVLHGIGFQVKKGERLFITGPNGCGKSTLLKCMVNLMPYQGEILICGENVCRMSKRELARRVGILFQLSDASFPYTVYETVSLGRYAYLKGIFRELTKSDQNYVDDCIAIAGLSDLRNKKISELSGGQLQRVYLAKLFAQDPELILLDEPTNHLDLKYQIELLEFVTDWSKKAHKTVVGVLHDLTLVKRFSKRVLLLSDGKIYSDSTPEESLSEKCLLDCYGLNIKRWMCDSLKLWK